MSDESSVEGGSVPEMLAKLRRGSDSGSPRWERFAMRLVVGHLLAYNIPGLDKVRQRHCIWWFMACCLGALICGPQEQARICPAPP